MSRNMNNMKLFASFLGIASIAHSASGAFRVRSKPIANHEFVVSESQLDAMLDEPPSFSSTRETSSKHKLDIVSFGSVTRLDYFTGQAATWASHDMVRHFWGLSELQDYDTQCGEMSPTEIQNTMKWCQTQNEGGKSKLLPMLYGILADRSADAGWVCAQRRLGRAFGWLQSVYSDSLLPDYLLLVDDDTYVDLDKFNLHLVESSSWALAGCVSQENQK